MRQLSLLNIFSIVLILMGCGKSLPTLDNFDMNAWQEDKNGCLSKRSTMIESIEKQKGKLLALNEKQIVKLLGKPDQNELYKRNQKFFSYFLTAAPACDLQLTSSKVLIIRFTAMGVANEVNIE